MLGITRVHIGLVCRSRASVYTVRLTLFYANQCWSADKKYHQDWEGLLFTMATRLSRIP